MSTLEELVIQLSADTKDLQAQMKSAVSVMEKSTNDMAKSVEGFSKDASKSTSFFQNAMATMAGYISGEAVLGAISTVKDVIFDLFKDGIEGAKEAESAFHAFNQALVTTGTYTEEDSNKFKNFADNMQNATGITAEAVMETGKLLVSLTSLRGQGLEDATTAIANMATVLEVDMTTASRSFSKAISGHAEGLSKLGIIFDASGDKATNAANLIEALNSKFGGSAAAKALTYAGAMKIVKQSFGEITEEVGKTIVENKAIIDVMNQISKVFISASNDIGKNTGGIKIIIAEAIKAMFDFGSAAISVAEFLKPVWDSIAFVFKNVAASISSALVLATDGFSAYREANVRLEKELADSWNNIGKSSDSLALVRKNFDSLAVTAGSAIEDMRRGGNETEEAMKRASDSVKQLPPELSKAQLAMQEWALAQAQSADSIGEVYAIDLASLQASFDAKLISQEEYQAAKEALVMQNIDNENAMLDQAAAQGLIKGEQLEQARYVLLQKSEQAQLGLHAARIKSEDDLNKTREQNFKSSLNTIATLSQSNNKALAAIGKAAAISQATIDGYAAVQKALASAPPPYNFALAAGVGVATAANVAKIVGTPLATGIDQVPGAGFKDNFPAVLAPGERVVPRETNKDLTNFLNQGGPNQGANITVNVSMHDIFTSDPREMGMKIIETINEASQANGIKILNSVIR